jgi:hypothetical protein
MVSNTNINNMKYRCDHCDEYHDIGDLTIDIGDEGHKLIDDMTNAVMHIVEKRPVPYELLIYAIAANLEHAKQAGLKLGKKSHRIEIQKDEEIGDEES